MALRESATHGLSFGEQCEPVVQKIEAARFLISQHGIGRRHEAANTKKLRSAESVVNQGTEFAGRAAGVFQDKERPRRRRPEAFGWMKKECHRGLLQARGRRQSRRCTSNRTRPISWLGSISSGTHPRTKGARCFTGGRRDRIPSTPRSLLAAREARRQETLRSERKNRGSRESRGAPFADQPPSRPAATRARQVAHTVAEGIACWGGPATRGAHASPPGERQARQTCFQASGRLG